MSIIIAIVEDNRYYNNALKEIVDFEEELLCVGQFFEGVG